MLVSDHAENYEYRSRRETMRVAIGMLGGILVLNSALAKWFLPTVIEPAARDFSAIFGVLLLGAPIAAAAVRDLLRGATHMSELAALAIAAAVVGGDYRTAGGVAFLLFITGVLEHRTAVGAEAAIEVVVKLTPRRARRLHDGTEKEVDALELCIGDICRVRPGENLPADGRVVVGAGSVNEASVTGESLPVDKSPGDEVFAGTQSLTGALDIEVMRVGLDTTIGRVRDLIAQAQASRLPVMRTVDRYASYYTPTVLMVAAVVWFFTQDMTRVISVLVVSCPCTLILAAPSALVAAVAAAARLGVLIKDVSHLEVIACVRSVVFDKTGTLTKGDLEVARLEPTDGVDLAELLEVAATAECHSNHPAAKAVRRLAKEAGVTWTGPSAYREAPGQGVEATVDDDVLRVGRESWLRACGIDTPELCDALDASQTVGMSLVSIARNQRFLGWIGLRDAIRPETTGAIAELAALGIGECWMVTGDNERVARRVGATVGISETRIRAACLPDEKVAVVHEVRGTGGTVAVVGDGVNDGPALAAGDIGVAMGAAGSDVAMHSASVALMNNDLRRIPFLIRLAIRTHRTMMWNMVIGLTFIVVGLGLSASGRIAPLAAALLHSVGTLIVIFNSARLVRAGETRAP